MAIKNGTGLFLSFNFWFQLIQCPVPNESTLNLLAVQKDQDATVSVAARIVVSSMSSLPIDYDVDTERGDKQGPGIICFLKLVPVCNYAQLRI